MNNKISNRYLYKGSRMSGGMSNALLFFDEILERDVIIKSIKDSTNLKRLLDEIRALQAVRSNYVVQIFDMVRIPPNEIKIVQEYLPGDDLVNYHAKNAEEYLKILYQLSSGLQDIHDHQIIHRDIKLNNVKYDSEGYLKIFDFGLSRFQNVNDSTVGFRGTIGYAAPELYSPGIINFTKEVDTYAFGISAWYLSGAALTSGLKTRPPTGLDSTLDFSSLPIKLPNDISKILNKTLEIEPQNRPTIQEIKEFNWSLFIKR